MALATVKDKRINQGNEKLFKIEEWIPQSEIDNEEKILSHPLMHEAFNRILKQHKPVQRTAFLSLCTSSRPYYNSAKWSKFIDTFHKKVDFIVVSNGGMIPESFWESYPYLNYDGGDHYDIKVYQDIMYDRMVRFFKEHHYDYVIANFRPNLINHEPAHASLKLLKEEGYVLDYAVIPDEETYEKARELGFRPPHGCGDMFPDLTETVIEALSKQVEEFGYDESLIPIKPSISDWM